MGKREKNPKNKVGLVKMLLWQSSSVSVAISAMVLGFVTIYCTDALGMDPALVGTMFMFSKLIDSVTDVFAGFIIDRTETKWGRGRPYEIFMVFLWLSTWLLFSCPEGFSTVAKSIWIFSMYVFMNAVCTTFLNGNNVVYMIRAFETKEQQVKLTAYGSFFTMGAAIIFNVSFPMLMSKMATSAAGWSRLIGMIAIPLTLLGILRMLTIKEQYNIDVKTEGEKLKLKDVVTLFKTNQYVLILSLVRFIQNAVANMGVSVYYWTYIVKNVALMGVTSLFSIITLPVVFVLPVLRKKFGMGKMVMAGMIVSAVGYLITFFAGDNIVLLLVSGLITGVGVVPFSMLFNIFLVDCADYNEWIGNHRMEGTMGSLTGLASKVGAAFGGFLLGIMLSAAGYDGNLAVQSGSAVTMIRIVASLLPMALYLLIAFLMRFYKLDARLPEIKADIEARRNGQQGRQ